MAAEFAMMLLSSFQKIKLSHTFNPVNLTRCKWEKSFQRQNQQVSEDLLQIKRLLETVYLVYFLRSVGHPLRTVKHCARQNEYDIFTIIAIQRSFLYSIPFSTASVSITWNSAQEPPTFLYSCYPLLIYIPQESLVTVHRCARA